MSAAFPWGRSLAWPEIQGREQALRLEAGAAALSEIARTLDLEALASLTAELTLRPWLDGVEIEGRIDARATRLCGLTLEPFEVAIREPVRLRVVPAGSPNAPRADAGEVIVDLDAEDPPDECPDGRLDLSAYVAEALALSLDPFPRKPGAVFSAPEPAGSLSPFAALAGLKDRPPRG